MDPISAVGLASSVLTFVEFAWNLVGGAVEIYRSVDGNLNENPRLDDVQDDLDSLTELLSVQFSCKTRTERKITRLAGDCRADSETLQTLLKEIAGPRNNRALWRSLKASWLSIRRRKDVSDMKDRLQVYRSEALLHVTLLLRDEQSSINLGIAKLRDECSQLKVGFRTQITSTQNRILGAIDTLTECNSENQATNDTCLTDISKMLNTIQAVVDDTHLQHQILRQLVFEDMNSRANQICKAAHDTYRWTVEDGPVNEQDQRRKTWNVFLEWLRAGDQILHVSGNPGSGKSTLMKFLSQHERTMQELQAWAGTDTLIFCVFYFWKPGSKMQRTLTGLYRSLLFQALSKCPELTERVFPVQSRTMKASIGDPLVENIQNFGEDRVEEAFKLLLSQASTGQLRLCLFIDGLDECEGDRLQHEDLTKLLQTWVNNSAIKICMSSRPYSEFLEPLNLPECRLIQLHDLNASDITAYCVDRLAQDVYAQKRGDLCRRLVPIVGQHSQGVFLWVHLVIDMLLVGFRQADPDSVLEAQLMDLPSDLDELYTKLREPIETNKRYWERSNRMLLLAAYNPGFSSLTAMSFSWLDEQDCTHGGLTDPEWPPASVIDPYSDEEIHKRLDYVKKQIDGLARGFLEVRDDPREVCFFASSVRFCHRTAQDYFLQNEHRRRELLKSFPNFQDSQPYVRIHLAETIHGCRSMRHDSSPRPWPFDRAFCQTIQPDLVRKFKVPVQQLSEPQEIEMPRCYHRRPVSSSDHLTPQFSFTAYAAYCGLDRFVLDEVSKEATRLDEAPKKGSPVVAAAAGHRYDLIWSLLTLDGGISELCLVSGADVQLLVPAYIIAMATFWGRMLHRRPSGLWIDNNLDFAKKFVRFSLDKNISMFVTISWYDRSEKDSESLVDKTYPNRVQVEVAGVVKYHEALKNKSEGWSTGPSTSLATDVAPETSSDNARCVEGQGVGEMQRLVEWLHQPDILAGHKKSMVDTHQLNVDKIEWSSDTQELVEVRGWTRLW